MGQPPQTTFLPQSNLFDNFFDYICLTYTLKVTGGVQTKHFLLAPLAALFYTPIIKMVAPPLIAMVI